MFKLSDFSFNFLCYRLRLPYRALCISLIPYYLGNLSNIAKCILCANDITYNCMCVAVSEEEGEVEAGGGCYDEDTSEEDTDDEIQR